MPFRGVILLAFRFLSGPPRGRPGRGRKRRNRPSRNGSAAVTESAAGGAARTDGASSAVTVAATETITSAERARSGGIGAVAQSAAPPPPPAQQRGRSRLITAVVGVALSLVPLVVVQQIADGMISGIVSRFIETGSYHVQGIARSDVDTAVVEDATARVAELPGVVSVTGERQGFGLLYSDAGRSGVTIRGVTPTFWRDDPAVDRYIAEEAGAFDLSGEDSIVVGTHTADRLNIAPGDSVRLLTVKPVGEGRMLPRVSRFTVAGVVSTGYRDLDRLWVFIPFERGMRIVPNETARDIIGVKIAAPLAISNPLFGRGIATLAASIGDRSAGAETSSDESAGNRNADAVVGAIAEELGPDWFVSDWYSLERGRYISFLTSRNLLAVVMAMIVIVAAINVSSVLVLLVVEKEQEIAILRATGIDAVSIGRAFIVAGLIVGAIGSVIGTTIGVAIAIHINDVLAGIEGVVSFFAGRSVDVFSSDFYLEEIPVTLRYVPIALSVMFTLVVALVAGALPARRATKIEPNRILRHSA